MNQTIWDPVKDGFEALLPMSHVDRVKVLRAALEVRAQGPDTELCARLKRELDKELLWRAERQMDAQMYREMEEQIAMFHGEVQP